MSLKNTYNIILEELSILKTSKTKPLSDAIQGLRKIEFYYSGPRKPKRKSVKAGRRFRVEPFAIGPSKKGNLLLRAWIEPPSTSKTGFAKTKWRTFKISNMSDIKILDETFGKRDGYNENKTDGSMSTVYISADFSKKPKIIRKPKPPTKPTEKPKEPEIKKEPVVKPEEPKDREKLPQPKPETKPEPPEKIGEPETKDIEEPLDMKEPEIEDEPKNIPTQEPIIDEPKDEEDEENKNIQESINRIKTLMFFKN